MTNIKLEAMRDKLRKILMDKCITSEACEYAIDELLDLYNVSKNEVTLKCKDCNCELPKGMKTRCYSCYDEIYFP